jgi:hypothetical protein
MKLPKRVYYVTQRNTETGALSLVPGQAFTSSAPCYAKRDELNKASGDKRFPFGWVRDLDLIHVPKAALDAFPADTPIGAAMRRDLAVRITAEEHSTGLVRLDPRGGTQADVSLSASVRGIGDGPVARVYLNEGGDPRNPERLDLARYLRRCVELWAMMKDGPPVDPVFTPGADGHQAMVVTMTIYADPVILAAGGWRAARDSFPPDGPDGWGQYRETTSGGLLAADMGEIIAAALGEYMPEGGYEIADLTVAATPAP